MRPPPRWSWLPVAAAVLAVSVLVLPFRLAAIGPGGGYPSAAALGDAVTAGFVRFWSAGTGELPTGLAEAVDFWARFHLVKAVLAAALLAVLVALGPRVLARWAGAQSVPQRLLAALVVVVHASVAVLALLVVVANLQGAVAPLSSVLGLMAVTGSDTELAASIAEVRQTLAAGERTPALDALLADFTTYHVVMAWLGGVVTVGLVVTAILLWRRRARLPRTERRLRRLVLALAGAALVLAGFFGVVTAANVSTAARPAPALLGFFQGGS
ncbi:hypothetical protein FHX52_2294 [Humibacillus xanthopallidus]|uniref:Uncharacterized protein n=1 Tax=Humibacillus xanthopallidus TaxID=412689 RepID=A0A543PND9_9MICO|nr:hypothetical protein [Humibacillus xanthopallidus]TQN45596.1 hypothetical protein FHX52_2294 [Humibacillus xanthopallidus]